MAIDQQELERLRSDEVQEILGTPPKWIVRWGNTITFVFLVAVGLLSGYIKYPEKINGSIELTSSIPPADIFARQNGYIEELTVEDSSIVARGQLLGIISSTTKFEDVTAIETYLDKIKSQSELSLADVEAPIASGSLQLGGDIQVSYSNFIEAFENFRRKVKGSTEETAEITYQREIQGIRSNIRIDKQTIEDIEDRIRSLDALVAQKQDEYSKGAATYEDLQRLVDQRLDNRENLSAYRKKINDAYSRIAELKELKVSSAENLKTAFGQSYTELSESITQLRSKISSWKEIYVLNAPSEGLVIFSNATSQGQYVKSQTPLMTIIPTDSTLAKEINQIVGKLVFSTRGAGKVKYGQLVKIKMNSYPAHEYGLVQGKVAEDPLLPIDGQYTIQVDFPKGLLTTFGKQLKFDQRMQGEAVIITADKNFLNRIFEKVIEIFV